MGKWTRFAVTYDATRAADNVRWYFSQPQDEPQAAAVAGPSRVLLGKPPRHTGKDRAVLIRKAP